MRRKKALSLPAAVLTLILLAPTVYAAPSITATTNPVMLAAGQTQGNTTITWNAENNTRAEVWL
jgi:hypothetical protein